MKVKERVCAQESGVRRTCGSMDTMAEVVREGLCTGCGTCAGLCPSGAISMRIDELKDVFYPEIDYSKCNYCGVCLRVCPGYEVNFQELNQIFFGSHPNNVFVGNYLRCYVGHSNDSDIRYRASSGGIVTHLLVYLLENNMIDGALVTRMKKSNPLEPEPFLATTREEILSAIGSKYCPAPTNLGLKRLLEKEGKFAVVGLPCHLHGIRKAETVFKELRNKISIHLGLFCAHNTSFKGTELILKKLRLNKNEITRLSYRGLGWPGSLSIETRNRKGLVIPLTGSWNAYYPIFDSYFFVPWRCMLCPDQFNELCDISVGDPWLREFRHDELGQSLVIIRSKKGEQIMTATMSSGSISMRDIDVEKVIKSQSTPLKFKKRDFGVRLSLIQKSGKKVPWYNFTCEETLSISSFIRNACRLRAIYLSKSKLVQSILPTLPFSFFRFYNWLFSMLYKLP